MGFLLTSIRKWVILIRERLRNMTKEEINHLVEDHKDSFVQILKSRDKQFCNEVSIKFTGKSFSEKLYRWSHEGEFIGLCERCKSPTAFLTFMGGYRKYCSAACSNIVSRAVFSEKLKNNPPPKNPVYWENKECVVCHGMFWVLKFRNQKTCSAKCSGILVASDPERISKIQKTKLARYGSKTYVNPNKAKKACLEKYGIDNVSKASEVIEKIKQTNIERFGTDWSWQAGKVKDKIKSIIQEKYGVDNVSQSPEIKERVINTSLDRYNVSNPSKAAEVIEKIKQTNIERFGNVCPLKNPLVYGKARAASKKIYYRRIKSRLSNRVEFLFSEDEYVNTFKIHVYKFKCKKCNQEFEDHIDGGRIPRCMICYPYLNGISQGEKDILEYVKFILPSNIIIEDKCWSVIGNKELDIYIPSIKIAIEYDGLYWHSEIGGNKNRQYHFDKYNKCKERGIRLIQIFEDEWVDKNEIVKCRLSSILGNETIRFYARECEVKDVSNEEASAFIEKYHIQGNVPSRYRIGLFYGGDLLSIMTFGPLRIATGGSNDNIDVYELLRMVSSKSVTGGASKMFSYFVKTYNPTSVISYADLRWNTGKVYENMSMVGTGITPPNYWYYKPGYNKRYHRFSFRKNILSKKLEVFDPELTEWQNMQLNGYDRIWDCGSARYEWKSSHL